jgi:hypothetical protein
MRIKRRRGLLSCVIIPLRRCKTERRHLEEEKSTGLLAVNGTSITRGNQMAALSHLLAYMGRDFEPYCEGCDWGGRVDMVLWCDDRVNSKTDNILVKGAAILLTKITYIIEKSVGTQLAPLIFRARCRIA